MFRTTCFHCFVLAVATLAALGAPPTAHALQVYAARARIAERILIAWRAEGWTHVALTGEPRVGVLPVLEPWTHGGAWHADSKAARDLIVAALAQGVSFEAPLEMASARGRVS